MRTIALVHLALLVCLPLGALLLWRVNYGRASKALAITVAVIWILPLLLLVDMWPLDFVMGHPETRITLSISTKGNGYRIEAIEAPDGDFYTSTVRVEAGDGRVGCFSIDPDDSKWWFAGVERSQDMVWLTKWFGLIRLVGVNVTSEELINPERSMTYRIASEELRRDTICPKL